VDGQCVEEFVSYDVLKEFSRERAAAQRLYRGIVEQCLLDDDAAMLQTMCVGRHAIGVDRFVAGHEARIEQRRTGGDADRDLLLQRRVLSIQQIDEAVAGHFRVGAEELTAARPQRRRSEDRGRGVCTAAVNLHDPHKAGPFGIVGRAAGFG
jgi:hypothetical protein